MCDNPGVSPTTEILKNLTDVVDFWVFLRFIPNLLKHKCFTEASDILATYTHLVWFSWYRWHSRPMSCYTECPDGLGLLGLYHDRAGELMEPWEKAINVYRCPSPKEVNCFWSSLRGMEKNACVRPMATCHGPEIMFIYSSKHFISGTIAEIGYYWIEFEGTYYHPSFRIDQYCGGHTSEFDRNVLETTNPATSRFLRVVQISAVFPRKVYV